MSQNFLKVNSPLILVLVYMGLGMASLPCEEITVETGFNYSIAQHQTNTFSRGLQKFRSSFNPSTLRYVDVDPFEKVHANEYSIRATLLDSPHHFIGFGFGDYNFADFPLLEIRNDSVITQTQWSFSLPYFLFSYTYVDRIPGRWNRKFKLDWDGGASFGFITGSRWKVQGASVSPYQALRYDINQKGRIGNLAKLDLGVRKNIWDGFHLRVGLGASYTQVGRWDGEINDGNGTFYYMKDGSLVPVSSLALLSSSSSVTSPSNNISGASLIKSRASFDSGFVELKLGIVYRF